MVIISPKTNLIMLQNSNEETYPGNVKTHSDNRGFTCGCGASLISVTATFPVNKVMFRQMLYGISTTRAVSQLKKEGFRNLYRGVLPPLCQKTFSYSVMFGAFDKYENKLRREFPSLNPSVNLVASASLAGFTEAILCPLERIQTVLQDRKYHGKYNNTFHCASGFRQFGLREYYRGLYIILIRNSLSNVLFFGLRKQVSAGIPSVGDEWYDKLFKDFVSGSLLGATISSIMYPLNVVKSHQQCHVGHPYRSVYATFLDVYEARGRRIAGLFKGVHVNYTRALVSWGLLNASYEFLVRTFYEDKKDVKKLRG